MKRRIVYMDTNVLNKLAYVVNKEFVFERMKQRGYILGVSEVNILEVLSDRNDMENIDIIITMIQKNSNDIVILPSVPEIIYKYLTEDKKETIKRDGILYDVLKNSEKEFVIDEKNELLFKKNKSKYKMIDMMISIVKNNENCGDCRKSYCDYKIDQLAKCFSVFFLVDEWRIIEPSIMNSYWEDLKIYNKEEKEKFIDKNLELIVKSDKSPFRNMGRFALLQNKRTNGTFNDCLHSCFFDYVDKIVSDDKHFINNVKRCESYEEFMRSINIKIEEIL